MTTTSHRPSRLAVIAVVLAFAAGATDAFAFLQLNGVFTANMTGNLVLAGLTERPNYPTMIAGVVVAILVFAAALYVAFRVSPPGAPRPRNVAVLTAALVAQVAVLIGWVAVPTHMSAPMVAVLIALSSVAMACQTAVAKRIEGNSGVTTTYVTGTLTSLMGDFADRKPQDLFTRIGVIVALVAGALSGSLLIGLDPVFGAALPVLPALVGTVLLQTAGIRPLTRTAGAA